MSDNKLAETDAQYQALQRNDCVVWKSCFISAKNTLTTKSI